ncbi:MAG: YdiU family protein [Peptostreptococcaceae bacterium]|nr:YdiU family protein [Peptostreptococcaceae bacterium]
MEKQIVWDLENSYENLPKEFFTYAKKSNFPEPNLVLWNEKLAKDLGFPDSIGLSDVEKAGIFSGNEFLAGTSPIAQAYAGHQYGYLNMLGDGRAILLGEKVLSSGERVDVQLKGSGRTVYSRGGDGRASLAPMLREYLISEAMAAFGIPSTRSLAVVTTGEDIRREGILPGAVLTRVASSHIRVGTFQFAASLEPSNLRALADYTILRHFSHLAEAKEDEKYRLFLRAVIENQASLIAKWQSVGFIHGVMNTDNMVISGETIDYGPCAFMDAYNPKTVFSSIDRHGRYRYENQPPIAQWNLARFAETLLPLLSANEEEALLIANEEIMKFKPLYEEFWFDGICQKLGIFDKKAEDATLIDELLSLMLENEADFTNTFVRLTLERMERDGAYLEGTQRLFADENFERWHQKWSARLENQKMEDKETASVMLQSEIARRMQEANPFVIPRNFRVEEVLQKALEGELNPFRELLSVLQAPYRYDEKDREYQELPKYSMAGYRTFCGT